ncbi:hypothetical protein, partial [Polaromonas sp.]|uniref:hypothetical protein n=1 Tax=Polaromonas sp. TaxID=1869339 RepID=UPI00356195C2
METEPVWKFLVLGFFNQAPARPPEAPPDSNWQTWNNREYEFHMAQRTQLDDSGHPLHEAYACLLANGLDGA